MKYGENDKYMSHLVSYKWFRKTQVIQEYVVFYKEVGRLWRLSDCEELVGVKLFLELVQIVRKILFGNERNYLLFYPLVCYTNL